MPIASGEAPRARDAARTSASACTILPALALGLIWALPAGAQGTDRWAADETGARATFPTPQGQTAVTSAALSCEAQRWTLHLALPENPVPSGAATAGETGATLDIDGAVFEMTAAVVDGGLDIALPRPAIDPLKGGLRVRVEVGGMLGEAVGKPNFSLRGSRIAISAAQDRCSLRDMSAYTPVTFSPYSSYIRLGGELRKDDIAGFKVSTASEPQLTVAMTDFDGGQRVLFTRLCGSSWYYGASGCNITGFAPEGEGWRTVYDTENVHLYTDPKAVTDGWPDIVTLPARNQGAGLIWRWDGRAYALKGELPEDEDVPAGEDAGEQAVESANGTEETAQD